METIISDKIGTFGKVTPAVNQRFVTTSRIGTSACHSIILKQLIGQSYLFNCRYAAQENCAF